MHHVPSGPRLIARITAALSRRGRHSGRGGHSRRTTGQRLLSLLALWTVATVGSLSLVFATATTASGETGLALLSSSPHTWSFFSGGRKSTSRAAQLGSDERSRWDRSKSSRSQRQPHPTGQGTTTATTPDATASTFPTSSAGTSSASTSSATTPPATMPSATTPSATTSSASTSSSNSLRPPASIASDCSTDVTAPLTQWVNSLPDRSSILFAQNGCYLVNGSITVTRKTGLTIDGNGSTFKATRPVPSAETNRAQWHADYGADLTFKNMTLVGIHPPTQPYNAAYEYDHNLFIRGTNGVLVDHVVAKNAYGDNVAIAQGLDWKTIPGNITISNSVFDGAGRMGLSCVACHDVTVDHNTISNTAIFSFDLEIEGNNWPGKNVRFTNNVISGALGGAMFSIGAPVNWSGVDIRDIYIAGNKMTTFANGSFDCDPAISLKDSKSHVSGITIENNELYSISDGVLIKDASDVVVRNNVMHFKNRCGGTAGVHFVSVTGGQAYGNTTSEFPTPYREDGGR